MEFKGVKDRIILCKVTSRSRLAELQHCVESYLSLADNPHRLAWLFSFDTDDKTYDGLKLPGLKVYGHSESKIHAINRDVQFAPEDWHILLNISDDQIAVRKGWDTLISEAMPNDLDHSLWFNDGLQKRINTQEIVGINYYKRFGYIYHPSYKSFYCDNESTDVAKSLDRLIHIDTCIIEHRHPAGVKTVKYDELYNRNQKFWAEDEANYKLRNQNGFT